MAHIEIARRPEEEISVFTVEGAVSAAQLAESIEAYFDGPVTRLVLWDFREADLSGISSESVRHLTAVARTYAGRRPGGRTALVFGSDADYGLGRMYEIQRTSEDPGDVTYGVFRDHQEAMDWLRT